jgi:hypothetical protein
MPRIRSTGGSAGSQSGAVTDPDKMVNVQVAADM